MKITHAFFDFDGVFTDNNVYCFDDGREAVKCTRADGIGLQMLKDSGVAVQIVSTEANPIVIHRAKKMNVLVWHGCENKLEIIEGICSDLSKAVFIGNDINDLEAMKAVGYRIMPLDATFELMEGLEDYQSVTVAKGGQGAVRTACRWIIAQNKKEAEDVKKSYV